MVNGTLTVITSRKIISKMEHDLTLQYVAWSCCDQVKKEIGRHKMIGEKVNYRIKVVIGKYWYRNRVGEEMNVVWDAGVWLLVHDRNPPDKLAWRCVRKEDVDFVYWKDNDSNPINTTEGECDVRQS